jgi:HSP20 family protein
MSLQSITSMRHPARENGARAFPMASLAMSWLGITQHDEADAVTWQLPVPGYRRRDLSIEVRERLVTVRGERADGWLKQRSRKSFTHAFTLPESLDEHQLSATFLRGVLQLKIAKKPHARRRSIPVFGPNGTKHQPAPPATATGVPWSRLRGWLHDVRRRGAAVTAPKSRQSSS